jgi:hypothetical protein
MKKILLTTIAALLLATGTANAATLDARQCDSKTEGCYVIALTGTILPGDGDAFNNLVASKSITNALVTLNSPGGDFESGLSIAYAVRRNKFTTWVGDGWDCASMCATIWVAGARRFYQGKAKIGFHGIYWAREDYTPISASSDGNALLGAFYNQIGLSSSAIKTLTEQTPNRMYWLNKNSAVDLSIPVEEWK